jgi:C4-dicarboxylate-specific signal transduction histidine kinase
MPDGLVKSVHVVARAVKDESGKVEFVGAVMDVSAAKRAEQELRQVQAELAHVTRVTTLGELTASIAHEVNQPITGVVTNATVALRWLGAQPPNLDEVREALGRIVKDGGRAGDVIHRIRALIKKAPPRMAPLDINEAVLDVIALTRTELLKHDVSLQTQLATGLPLIEGDRVQLQQVILNLILNAVEAMSSVDEGTRELQISTGMEASNGVLVTVRDFGPGLDPQSADDLFEAFYTTKPAGLGMGLPICRSIIEAHGGRLWATADDPRGAVFQFTLPLERDDIVPAEHAGPTPVV